MHVEDSEPVLMQRGISLVDGDPAVRRARQLMLRAENYDVRSYASCAAIIADPASRASACLIADVDMPEIGGLELLRRMRGSGWHGTAILLDGGDGDAAAIGAASENGDTVVAKSIADWPLLKAIQFAIDYPAPA